MAFTQNILEIIELTIDVLKTMQIFPGFSMYQGMILLVYTSLMAWVLSALGLWGGASD